tara:strand:- start:287 stop:700 length:414 start_codon:yes stop_codon:yes gene_type:complete
MFKRFVLFGFGVIISIFFLSLGPENRMKKTFYAYVDYFSINKRVITHLYSDNTIFTNISECQLVYFGLTKENLLSVLDGGTVNFSKSDKKKSPCQLFLIENIVDSKVYEVLFKYCDVMEEVSVMNINIQDQPSVCVN